MSSSLQFNPPDFLHSLCKWIAARSGLLYQATAPAKANLVRNTTDEKFADDPYTVLAIYPGSPLFYGDRCPTISVQARTSASVDDPGLKQIQSLFESLLDNNGCPIVGVTIDGFLADDDSSAGSYRIKSVDLRQRPGLIGRDDRGVATFTFNFDVAFVPGN